LQDYNRTLETKLAESHNELQWEKYLNELAWDYIPEAKWTEYMGEWPQSQLDTIETPPMLVSFNFGTM
jgi:hypothetical protein